mmetsp:Transcript_32165/g.69525  ORF Transcript_32165/g.69525 Transcript_32165/m.69525 type:complete len:102 (-) Transcript_32165:224-529(-)
MTGSSAVYAETTTSTRSDRSELPNGGTIVYRYDKAYNHEEALDVFLLGVEKDPMRFEKMIDCYRVAMDKRLERRLRELQLALRADAQRTQVKQCSPVCVEL